MVCEAGAAPTRERTGTAYLRTRERYEARYHAGNRRWQISDTQTRRWTTRHHTTEAGAQAIVIVLNAGWREQLGLERRPLGDRWAVDGTQGPVAKEDVTYQDGWSHRDPVGATARFLRALTTTAW